MSPLPYTPRPRRLIAAPTPRVPVPPRLLRAALMAAWSALPLVAVPSIASAQQPLAADAAALAAAPLAARVTAAADGAVVLNAVTDPAGHARVAAAPGQAFAVALQYPLTLAGEEIVADPIDGGRIDGRPWRKLKVGADDRKRYAKGLCSVLSKVS